MALLVGRDFLHRRGADVQSVESFDGMVEGGRRRKDREWASCSKGEDHRRADGRLPTAYKGQPDLGMRWRAYRITNRPSRLKIGVLLRQCYGGQAPHPRSIIHHHYSQGTSFALPFFAKGYEGQAFQAD